MLARSVPLGPESIRLQVHRAAGSAEINERANFTGAGEFAVLLSCCRLDNFHSLAARQASTLADDDRFGAG